MSQMTLHKILIAFTVGALSASAATNKDMLVDTAWLADHLNDPNLVIVQVGNDMAAYEAGHIPGAHFLSMGELVITKDGVPNELPGAAELKVSFEEAGVSDNSRIILYSEGAVLPATRAYFTLDYIGHGDQAALLDGGLDKWKAENRAVTTQTPKPGEGNLTLRPRPETVVSTAAVKDLSVSALEAVNAAPTLLDVRSASLFSGDGDRAGHIPGSVNLDWTSTQSKGSQLKSEESLRALYKAAGVDPSKPVITYCNSGMQASQSYFVLKYLGYDARLYDGSMSAWRATDGTTVEK